jgi:hypothetical protein
MSANMCEWDHTCSDRPPAVAIRDGRMFLIQRWLNIRSVFDNTLIVTEHVCWVTLWHWDTETTQLEAQMLDGLKQTFRAMNSAQKVLVSTVCCCLLYQTKNHNILQVSVRSARAWILMTMSLLGQLFLRTERGNNSRVPWRGARCFNGPLWARSWQAGTMFLMWKRNGRNYHVSFVSDTALSAASMRARISKEITEGGCIVFIFV